MCSAHDEMTPASRRSICAPRKTIHAFYANQRPFRPSEQSNRRSAVNTISSKTSLTIIRCGMRAMYKRVGPLRALAISAAGLSLALAGLCASTAFIAGVFNNQAALGAPLFIWGDADVYAPWSIFAWSKVWAHDFPKPFAIAHLIAFMGVAAGFVTWFAGVRTRSPLPVFGKEAWAKFSDIESAGLFASSGAVLGKFQGEIVAYDGPGHQILIGASRSGKGRGHVVPTLLTWNGSALVLDVKGELDHGDPRHGFPGTSGFRRQLGAVLRFAPTDMRSNAFNVLFCVRKGANEVRDVQNIVDIIIEPKGESRGAEQFWNNSAKIVITGIIIQVLYAEPVERKTLAIVREKLRDLDRTCDEMRRTLHRLNPTTNMPEVHAEVLHAAESYLAGEERLRSGIKATAESFFGIFADPIVAEKTSRSDFAIGDLMCADKPVTLYLQPPPSDAQRLMPLMRLFIAQVARSLMEDQTRDAAGRIKKHRLLLVLDEFPQLGRIDFFEKMMGAMAGYGLKAYLVCQSLNHIIRAYGRDNVILDNCALVTTFAAADPETAKHIANMAGETWEVRPQESEQRPRSLFGPRKGAITYREERRPLMLPADVRALPRDEQLIFAAGVKPIRAKKLKFDREPIFANRLLPPAAQEAPAPPVHDWIDVRALGMLPAEKKTVTAGRAKARADKVSSSPLPQNDLFGESGQPANAETNAAKSTPKISELALAGFRQAPAEASDVQAEAPRAARGTGI
jgi:type IV secretion system protein VirD4